MGCLESKEEKEKRAKLQADIKETENEIAKFDTPEEKAISAEQDKELQQLQIELDALQTKAFNHGQVCEGERVVMKQLTWTFSPQYQPILKIACGGKLDIPLRYVIDKDPKLNKAEICGEAMELNGKISDLCAKRDKIFDEKKKVVDLQTKKMQLVNELKSME